jgi:NADH:ubiquinone oxidoreductase subunit 6 (subunit J)
MSTSMARQVQVFVGGAIAVIGSRALIWIPRSLIAQDGVYFVAGVLVGLGLPLGVAMLRGRPLALRVAEVYLLLGVVGMCALFVVSRLNILPPSAPQISWRSLPDLLIPLVLLVLLLWSRLQHNQEDVEPSAAPNGGPATQLGSSEVTDGPPSVS